MTVRTATCVCGRLSATCTGDPIRVSVCHCHACKQRTGSAFSWNARWDAAQVVSEGPATLWDRTGDEGGICSYRFCPTCGATVWYTNSGLPGLVAVPVGGFAEDAFPAPSFSVYDARRPEWLRIVADPLEVMG